MLAIVAAPLVWDDWVAHLAAGAVCFAVLRRPGPIDGSPHVMAGVVVALVVGLA